MGLAVGVGGCARTHVCVCVYVCVSAAMSFHLGVAIWLGNVHQDFILKGDTADLFPSTDPCTTRMRLEKLATWNRPQGG